MDSPQSQHVLVKVSQILNKVTICPPLGNFGVVFIPQENAPYEGY